MHAWANIKLLPIFLLLLMGAFSSQTRAGEFSAQIKHASLERYDGWYMLDADVEYGLSPIAKEAIQSSIPLVWHLNVQVRQVRYFHNKILVNLSYVYKVRYHALLNSYSVTDEGNGTQKKYTSLSEALDALSRIRELKIILVSVMKKNASYEAAIKLEFDKEQLPAPLRPVAYFDSKWDLSSDWYLWQLEK